MEVFRRTDDRFMVRFSTTVPANTATVILSTAAPRNLVVPSGINFSPSITSSTTVTYGGRAYTILQVTSGASNVHVDLNRVDISTNTSPFVTAGQWWSPDDPVAWQGEIVMKSTSQFSVTGWMWFEKPRQ